jgi:hypothetical protein
VTAIPDFLSHRPTWGDLEPLPVPFVACWSDERNPRITRIIRWRSHPAIFTDRQSGVPDFGSTHSHRQRRCMDEGLCQICGEKGATLYVIPNDAELGGTHVHLWDTGRWIINAPVHQHCYEFSQSVCPHLRNVKPHAVVTVEKRPLLVVGYSDGVAAWPLARRPPGYGPYAVREAIVGVPDDG